MNYKYSKKTGALQEAMGSMNPPQAAPPEPPQESYVAAHSTQAFNAGELRAMAAQARTMMLDDEGMMEPPMRARGSGLIGGGGGPRRVRMASRDSMRVNGNDVTADSVDMHTHKGGGQGMFYYTVEEGQRVLMIEPNGSMEVIEGPRRVWRGKRRFESMAHHVAHPGEFLIVRFRDGRQEHMAGPAHCWFDAREHRSVSREEALQIAAKEAVVVYSERDGQVDQRICHGPATFVPEPGEWLHTFSWHGSSGGRKVPNGLVFQKLWLMPDQMYHDVADVRTADDAVLTVKLMIFFELVDIERMLVTTHDPIGDFVNAATSDVVEWLGRRNFEQFKQQTEQLNELSTYKQLVSRATQCGYRIDRVVYRGYGAPQALQQMHDQAIESRTRLKLERATEQQAQELADAKLERQLARAAKERLERQGEFQQRLTMNQSEAEAELAITEARVSAERARRRLEAEQEQHLRETQQAAERAHLEALAGLGVDLTALLTQGRADRVIELRGASGNHVHLQE